MEFPAGKISVDFFGQYFSLTGLVLKEARWMAINSLLLKHLMKYVRLSNVDDR